MQTDELNYDLPEDLIAQKPADRRSESRILVLERTSGIIIDQKFPDVKKYLEPGDCLVLNDTKVLPARFFGARRTGAKIEGLFLEESAPGRWHVMLKNSRKIKTGEPILLNSNVNNQPCMEAIAAERMDDGRWIINFDADSGNPESVLGRIGFPPLPPYIKRDDDLKTALTDFDRYQTVYAKNAGAIAAPTAGMHFTQELIDELKAMGVRFAFVTLHVGAGTFKPVTAETLDGHEMHSEWYRLDEENAAIINETKQSGKRVIALGTTSVRTLETVAKQGGIKAANGDTQLFIKPGFEFKAIDAMITNFHLPKSTLIALVGAFAGMDNIMNAYRHAIEQKYRFYSYGDSMFIS